VQATRRTTVLLVAAALLTGSFALASCGGDDEASGTTTETTTQTTSETTTTTETTTTETTTEPEVEKPTVVRVTVVDGAPNGGIVRATVDQGDRVRLVVTSDVADEIHLHGYDVSRDVAAGGTVTLAFRASIPGRFEAELEERGVQIADITVEP
jgi:Predicted solute binding protein